ncbi:Fe-S-containing protein [Terriglobus saanensis]|uniref:Iron permease FTR1 n=1 Tax=Terriglobus saanensis (strain ATCC BAA-1853 / DSM 23119 / SP1PR4) TaxID=401053 RepID=E8V0Y6_TERSS|nr:Fe-S-containing protein [Terriglobus saanensis]ADV82277.1 iron permease FTR1 [Terriglobus saanensis SP1PR4]
MLQAFIVTLREGVEAALIIGIVFAYLNKIGRNELKKTVFWGLGSAVLASILTAVVIAKLEVNTDIFEGWVMLLAAFFVVSMIWVMHKAAKGLKGEIEGKISRLAASPSAKLGLFFFVFLMVLREGVETVLILAAVSLNSSELMSFMGTLLGLAVSVVFGVMFARGSLRVNLGRFFKVTTVILYFVAFQLIVSGLHELSENGVLPSNKAEMRLIGPIVRNDLFFFITMLALAGIMMLMEYKRRNGVAIDATATAADRRKAEWTARRERMWMTAVCAASFLFIFITTAEFIYAKSTTSLSPAKAVVLTGSQVAVPLAEVNDDQLHRYSVVVDTDSGAKTVRFLLYRKPDGNVVSVADACQICGPVGFYIGPQGITCKMCASPLVPQSMGQAGGCNPVPLKSSQAGGEVMIAGSDLKTLAARFGA